MSDNPLLVNMDEKDKYKGTLFIESYDSLIDSITGQAQSELDLAFNAIGAVASTVSLVVDPFGSLLGSAFGWMMEHISILKELLDEVLGDPEDIQANVEATKAKAAELRVLAEDHRSSLATFDGWTGAASEKFQTSMDTMGKELDSLAGAVEGKAKVVAMMGTIVSVLRDIIRDAIAQFIGSVTANAAIGLAGAIFTFGGSLAYAGIQIAREAAELALTLGSKVKRVIAALAKLMGCVGDLDGVMAKVGKGWDRFDNAADAAEITYAVGQAYQGVDETIDKARQQAAAQDKLDAVHDKSEEASARYQAAKDAESRQADDVSKANADLSAATTDTKAAATDVTRTAGDLNRATGELNRTSEETNRAAEAVNRAAKSGDQSAYDSARRKFDAAKAKSDAARTEYDAAKQKYDAADAKYDAAKAKAVDAAANVARESRELSDAAQASYSALQDGKPADEASAKAYEEYLKETGGKADPELTAKNDAAKAANEAYEKANTDFMAKNAAAAEANAKAFASGTEADIKAAEQASREAQSAGKTLEDRAAEARTAGEAAAGRPGGAPAAEPTDPLEHARKVNASTGYGDAVKGDEFFGAFGDSNAPDAAPGTPDTSSPPVKH
ncbi:hypothetical protein C8D87_101804 [Lentzea atacamensis]|uniref:Uncharacterized protein n=1 Tax=Lentzea atacamensis TaxID=531938 RepID=A0ABX9EIW7_9PSEU|nr:hypothetical protein [Lentzea atacamensis]RAS70504.1 hypothetical protein C8D87_101804 [Lentzea atacamensis]